MPTVELWKGDGGSAESDLRQCHVASATSLESLRTYFAADDKKGQSWAAYVVGVLGVLAHEPETQSALRGVGGCSILVSSKVPEGKGVSSSAAVEVATMMAALGELGVTLHPPEPRQHGIGDARWNRLFGIRQSLDDEEGIPPGDPVKLGEVRGRGPHEIPDCRAGETVQWNPDEPRTGPLSQYASQGMVWS